MIYLSLRLAFWLLFGPVLLAGWLLLAAVRFIAAGIGYAIYDRPRRGGNIAYTGSSYGSPFYMNGNPFYDSGQQPGDTATSLPDADDTHGLVVDYRKRDYGPVARVLRNQPPADDSWYR